MASEQVQAAKKELARRELSRREEKKFTPQPFTPNATPGVNPLTGMVEQLLSGATFGNSDEIQGLIGAATTVGQTDQPFSERFKTIRDDIRGNRSELIEQDPALAHVSEGVGALTTGLGGLLRTNTLIGAAGVGAAEGALSGLGFSDEESLLPGKNTAVNAGLAAAGGAGLGPGSILLGRGLSKAGGKVVDSVKNKFPDKFGVPEQYAQQLAEKGVPDDDMARFMMSKGKVVPDPLYTQASQTGIPDNTINAIKSTSKDDRNAALKMLNIIKGGLKNKNFARTNRPGDIAGQTLEKFVRHVDDANRTARIQLNRFASKQLRGKEINIQPTLKEFADSLDDLGITLVQKKSGQIKPEFRGSLMAKQDIVPIKRVIDHVFGLLEKGQPDAYSAHRLKRAIDNNLVYDATNPMSSDATNLLRSLRRGVDKVLDDSYPKYDAINKTVAETADALNSMQSAAKSSFIPESENFGKQLGVLGRRLMGNQTSRQPLHDAIVKIENVARNNGAKFNDSSISQAFLVDDLEDIFGASAQTGFRGEITKAVQDVALQGRRPGHAGAEVAINALRGTNPDAQIKILEQLLSR